MEEQKMGSVSKQERIRFKVMMGEIVLLVI